MKIYKLPTLPLFAMVLVCSPATAAQTRQWLSYGPVVVEVPGKLTLVRRYGPPNFGENPKTDAKLRVPILVLSEPVNVRGNAEYFPFDVEVRGIKRIQLLLFNLKTPCDPLVGKRVLVRGTLIHRHTGGHYTTVLMEVTSIAKSRRGR